MGVLPRGTTYRLVRDSPRYSIVFARLEVLLHVLWPQPRAMGCDCCVWTEGVGHGFTQDIEGGIEVGLDEATVTGLKQPAFDTPTEVLLVMLYWFAVEEGALRGVAFLDQ